MHPLQQWEIASQLHQERIQEADHWRLARQQQAKPAPFHRLRQRMQRLSRHARSPQNLQLAHSD